ncbi:MAG TPA: LLM class flavin-dependent oxidoreductase [Cellulomonas sp.]
MASPERRRLQRIGFVHITPLDPADPRRGLTEAIDLFVLAESLGLDSGWLRTRHLQHGLGSPAVLFGALSQRTSRIDLGTAVVPLEHENPLRLAEDLAVADLLAAGRLQIGLSVHPPRFSDEVNDQVFGAGWREQDYSYGRIERLRSLLAGDPVREPAAYGGIGGDIDSRRVEPHAPGLADRLWYGAGSVRSAQWAGAAGLNLLVSNISSAEEGITDFDAAQRNQIDRFRAAHPLGERARVGQAHVLVPTDGATADQRERFERYVAARTPRTRAVQGRNTLIAPDLSGTTDQIVARLLADPAFAAADEFLVELPFELGPADWTHILTQLATEIAPRLGWEPQR